MGPPPPFKKWVFSYTFKLEIPPFFGLFCKNVQSQSPRLTTVHQDVDRQQALGNLAIGVFEGQKWGIFERGLLNVFILGQCHLEKGAKSGHFLAFFEKS